MAQDFERHIMQNPAAHMIAHGAKLRIRGAAPTAVSQLQLNAAPAPMTIRARIKSFLRPDKNCMKADRPVRMGSDVSVMFHLSVCEMMGSSCVIVAGRLQSTGSIYRLGSLTRVSDQCRWQVVILVPKPPVKGGAEPCKHRQRQPRDHAAGSKQTSSFPCYTHDSPSPLIRA
ncbi:hypothetical protein [Paracoccus methylarcula]|uniref:hypothetical protein n=1 Tax=Paracoccus methylarcula TaxID=72022 RepID=UPI001B87042E|nr:hypothetical protein [Paracoccus methylarcula]